MQRAESDPARYTEASVCGITSEQFKSRQAGAAAGGAREAAPAAVGEKEVGAEEEAALARGSARWLALSALHAGRRATAESPAITPPTPSHLHISEQTCVAAFRP